MPSDNKLTDRTQQSSASLEPWRKCPLYRSRTAPTLVPQSSKEKNVARSNAGRAARAYTSPALTMKLTKTRTDLTRTIKQ